jgi:rubrerythrin
MTMTLNALEIFDIAGQIERNGAMFYRRAADIFRAPEVCKILRELADWESRHQRIFTEMREQLSQSNLRIQPSAPNQLLPEARIMAGLAVFGIRQNPADELNGRESETEILEKAIEKEKDSIVFYSGLKDFTAAKDAQDKIDTIIKEELHHIRILNKVRERKDSVRS